MSGLETPRRRAGSLRLAAAVLPPLLVFTVLPAGSSGSATCASTEARTVQESSDGTKKIQAGSSAAGERLFSGAVGFANGGPPCFSCHTIVGLPFPHGGILGPDLTVAWTKYGPEALQPVLTTLYFPTMFPAFASRPLTSAERNDLAAFFRAAAGRTSAANTTIELAIFAGIGLFALLVAVGRSWPRRLGSVRDEFLKRVSTSEGLRP
jgi:hypothetical protein